MKHHHDRTCVTVQSLNKKAQQCDECSDFALAIPLSVKRLSFVTSSTVFSLLGAALICAALIMMIRRPRKGGDVLKVE
jgi:hypothetical protein